MNWTADDLKSHYERLASNAAPVLKAEAVMKAPRWKNPMNKLEAEYAQQLEMDRRAGLISWFEFEPFKLRLAGKTFYTPDFAVVRTWEAPNNIFVNELEFHETKGGFWRDDARVKIKVAAAMFPFKFIAIRKKLLREGGGWQVEEFSGA